MSDTTTPAGLLPGGFHAFAPQSDFLDNSETNTTRPATDAVITVRIIKSFEYRSMKPFVIRGIDLTRTTVEMLEDKCRNGTCIAISLFFFERCVADRLTWVADAEVKTNPAFKAFRSYADKLGTLTLALLSMYCASNH